MDWVAYDRVRVVYQDQVTLDGVAGIKYLDIFKYEDEAKWRRIASRFGRPSHSFRPHYFVIARTVSGGTHPTMLQLMPLGNNRFETIALGRTEAFQELEADAIRLLTAADLVHFATVQPARTNLGVGLFLKL